MPKQTLRVPVHRLSAEFLADGANSEDRIASLRWYSGAEVQQFSWENGKFMLSLSMEPRHVRMGRLKSGKAPLLNAHSNHSLSDVLGVIESASIKNGEGIATVRFSTRPEVDPIWKDVQDGIIRNASVGLKIHSLKKTSKEEETPAKFMAVDWEPMEVSLVPLGADPNAGFEAGKEEFMEVEVESPSLQLSENRASAQLGGNMHENTNAGAEARLEQHVKDSAARLVASELEDQKQAGVLSEKARVMSIMQVNKICALPLKFAEEHISTGTTIDQFRALALDEQAKRSTEFPDQRPGYARVVHDEADTRRNLVGSAITGLLSPKDAEKDADNPYIGLTIRQIAEESVRQERGLRFTPSREQLTKFSMQNTSDFANALENSARKQLLARYTAAEPTFRMWCRASTTPDFKTMSRVRVSEAPPFVNVPEGAQITIGLMTDSKETYALATYGRGVSFTRQMLINDDLNAFNDLIGAFGDQAARLENQSVYAILTANANMADGNPLFDASHSNTGSGAIGNTGLDGMFTAMKKQTGVDGLTVLNIRPSFLIVAAAKEATGRAALTPTGPNLQVDDQNWFAGLLTLVADAELDSNGSGATKWYGAADPGRYPGIEFAHLLGAEGPQFIRKENESGVLGIQFYAYDDFAAKAVDWRPLYFSTGA
jgi:hypothetical protein